MFWKYLLYHTALWMCPPAACCPGAVEVAQHLSPPTPADVFACPVPGPCPACPIGYAPCPACPAPQMAFALPVPGCCPPATMAACAAPSQPKKAYTVETRLEGGRSVHMMMAVEEGKPESTGEYQLPSKERIVCCAGLKKVRESGVEMEWGVGFFGFGPSSHISRVAFSAKLNKTTTIPMTIEGLPWRAKVTVREMPAPTPTAMYLPSPAHPRFPYPLNCVPPQTAMPAPMPVGGSAPALQLACPLPEPMPISQPVVFEPAPTRRACTGVAALPTCVPGQPMLSPCAAVTTARAASHCFIRHKDKGVMECKCEDGSLCVFQRRIFELDGMGKLSLSAGKTCLYVKGADWKAYAEQIDVRSDGHVVLRGNVRLMCDKLGVCATVKAEELGVEVKKGKFEKLVTK